MSNIETPQPDVVDVYILVAGGDVFFSGYLFTAKDGLQPLASQVFDDAWMFPDEKTAVETRRDDPRLHRYAVIKISLSRSKRLEKQAKHRLSTQGSLH